MTSRSTVDQLPIAIVGIGCRFPGGITDADSFWRVLRDGVDTITEIPSNRIDVKRFYDPQPATPGRIMSRFGGYLDDIERFDAEFFGISPREAERVDPQQRLLLETAWESLEDAGVDAARLSGTTTGVFVGQWLSDFEGRLFAEPERVDFYMTTGSGRYAASGRVSYALGLRGPSLTLDTGCSSSLAAVHLAVRSLRSGESELALAGGVNIILQPHITVAYSQSRMMAADGRCKFGDAAGDGYVRSEGAGLLVLKPLDRAIADDDRVYAIIRGSAVNNDGNSSGSMGTPSRLGQVELLRSAYRDAGVSAGRVGYIEAHGTGTRAGDPVELGALGEVVTDGREVGHPVWIGSVKTNLGHTEGAAGVAGLIKAALAVHHGAIPASLHFRNPNPTVPWQDVPLQIPREMVSWSDDASRVAGVNSFGIGGTNAHVVLEQAPKKPTAAAADEESEGALSLLMLSARSLEALREMAARYAELLGRDEVTLRDVCWSAATRRSRLDHRAAFVAANRSLMADALKRYAAGETAAAESVVYGDAPPKIAFIFPGQGGQWAGMARDLVNREPVFRDAIARCDAAARPFLNESITDQLMNEQATSVVALQRIDIVQPLLVAIAIAYAELWRSKGVEPDAVVGHSMGEVAAAYVAGALTLEQAMRIICRRSALMRRTSGQGAMALVDLSMAEARKRLAGLEDKVVVAVGNSPRSSVISGDPAAVSDVIARLEREHVFCRPVKVDVASHSPQMDPVKSALRAELDGLGPTAARLPIYSTVAGRRLEGDAFDAGYWADNVRQPVLFGDTIAQMINDGITVFVELGPHPILLPSIQQTAQSLTKEITAVGCGHRDDGDSVAFARAIGAVACSGVSVDWSRIIPGGGRHVRLPSYPWQRQRHWIEAAELSTGTVATRSTARLDPSMQPWLHQLQWKSADRPAASSPSSTAPTLIVGAGEDASALSAAFAAIGGRAVAVSRSDFDAALRRDSYGAIVCVIEDEDGPYAPILIMQSLLAASRERSARVWFVTRGAQVVDGYHEQASVVRAALWGAARVIAEEHPEFWGGLIDLDSRQPIHEAAARVASEVMGSDADDQIAFRDDKRFVLRLGTLDREVSLDQAFQWRADVAYLVTGGLGDVGLHLARAMAAHGARRLILLGRTPLPPRQDWSRLPESDPASRRVAAIRELEAQGVAVHFAALDISDELQLTAFLAQYAAEAWPPIRGVVHAAGTLNNKLVRDMDAATFDSVVRAKVDGAQLLDRLLPELDVFVMCSSTGAFLAQPGQANYAAANAGLDAVAQNRRLRGARALSIEWGIWQDTGLVKGAAGERNVSELARQGVGALTPEQGRSLFAWLTRTSAASAAVLPVDWPTFAATRAGRRAGIYTDVLASLSAGGRSTSSLAASLAEAQPARRRQILESTVRDAVTQVLKISPSRLDPRKALGEMGLNSLMAMELRNRLEASLGRSLSATLAWNYPTVDAIVQHLATPVEPPPVATPSEDAQSGEPDALRNLNELSDNEAALALRSRV